MINIYFSKELSKFFNIFLWHLRGNKCCCQFFQLNTSIITFENLLYSCIFLKLTFRLVVGTSIFIQGWSNIYFNVILLAAGTKILAIKSFASLETPANSATKLRHFYCWSRISLLSHTGGFAYRFLHQKEEQHSIECRGWLLDSRYHIFHHNRNLRSQVQDNKTN